MATREERRRGLKSVENSAFQSDTSLYVKEIMDRLESSKPRESIRRNKGEKI